MFGLSRSNFGIQLIRNRQQVLINRIPICISDSIILKGLVPEAEQILKGLFIDLLLLFLFLLVSPQIILLDLLHKFYFWVVSVRNELLVVRL